MAFSHPLTVHRRGGIATTVISIILGQLGGTHDGFPQIATGPIASSRIGVLKNGASGRDPALRGFCNCSHIFEYAALSNRPRAWADGPMLVF